MKRFAWIGPGVGLLLGTALCPLLFCLLLWFLSVRDGSGGPIYDAINGPDPVGGKEAVLFLSFVFDAVVGALGGALAGQAVQQSEARRAALTFGSLGLMGSGIWIYMALGSRYAVETRHAVPFDPFGSATAVSFGMASAIVLATGCFSVLAQPKHPL